MVCGSEVCSCNGGKQVSLTPGKWADLAVLSGDPLRTPAEELLDIHVEQTYVGGKLVYEV